MHLCVLTFLCKMALDRKYYLRIDCKKQPQTENIDKYLVASSLLYLVLIFTIWLTVRSVNDSLLCKIGLSSSIKILFSLIIVAYNCVTIIFIYNTATRAIRRVRCEMDFKKGLSALPSLTYCERAPNIIKLGDENRERFTVQLKVMTEYFLSTFTT